MLISLDVDAIRSLSLSPTRESVGSGPPPGHHGQQQPQQPLSINAGHPAGSATPSPVGSCSGMTSVTTTQPAGVHEPLTAAAVFAAAGLHPQAAAAAGYPTGKCGMARRP